MTREEAQSRLDECRAAFSVANDALVQAREEYDRARENHINAIGPRVKAYNDLRMAEEAMKRLEESLGYDHETSAILQALRDNPE